MPSHTSMFLHKPWFAWILNFCSSLMRYAAANTLSNTLSQPPIFSWKGALLIINGPVLWLWRAIIIKKLLFLSLCMLLLLMILLSIAWRIHAKSRVEEIVSVSCSLYRCANSHRRKAFCDQSSESPRNICHKCHVIHST